jgi:hypothetical protein
VDKDNVQLTTTSNLFLVQLIEDITVKIHHVSRYFAKPLKLQISSTIDKFKFWLVKMILLSLRKFSSDLTLAYDSADVPDGTGAQLHRLLSIRALASGLNSGYLHTGIQDIPFHPLDSFKTEEEKNAYLLIVNDAFFMRDTWRHHKFDKVVRISHLRLLSLLFLIFESKILRRRILVCTQFVFHLSESLVGELEKVGEYLENFKVVAPASKKLIAIHYRQGLGNFVVYPGQAQPRELDEEYFIEMLNALALDFGVNLQDCNVKIFTDAPNQSFSTILAPGQIPLLKTPNSSGEYLVFGNTFPKLHELIGPNLQVSYGGDPFLAIKEMSAANYLLIAKSSLSYVAALLCEGKVISPPNFWHRSLPKWN